jgi:uncharacterized protein YndB with AHSA1/START domain
MPICSIDLRIGGRYHYVWREISGEQQFGFNGEYREISYPDRLVHSERMDGGSEDAICTLTFKEADGRTILTTAMLFPTSAARNQALENGMSEGMGLSYDRLDPLLVDNPEVD